AFPAELKWRLPGLLHGQSKGSDLIEGVIFMRLLLGSILALAIVTPTHAQLAPRNAAGITFGHVHLNVRDIEVHKKLWVEHFDGIVVQKGPLVAVKLPGMLIAFRQAAPTGGSEGTVMDHFGLKVRDLAAVL